jgi:hypothetical protein
MVSRNLYRIDDVLLRAGGVTLLLVVASAAIVVVVGLAQGGGDGRDPGLAALARHGPLLALACLCPIGLLCAGVALRQRERQIVAVWSLLRQYAEISVPGLLANADFTRPDLERAIRFLNNRGLAHYVWDRRADVIRDARLESSQLHLEKCDACGAAISLEVPLAFVDVPSCPYCHDPISFELLQERRREAIESLRAEHRPRAEERSKAASFSLPLFLLLLFLCWPAALGYAVLKWHGRL